MRSIGSRLSDAGLIVAMAAGALALGLMLLEVVLRYVFASPTVWTPEMVGIANGAAFVFGAGPALRGGVHVSVDAVARFMPARLRDAILALFFVALALPVLLWIAQAGFDRALNAYLHAEVNDVSPWRRQVWPHYALLTLGVIGLALDVLLSGLRHAKALRA
ncbi:MAG: C4-dicarboxylate ABC transporter substrate-binding protein [Tagaea sp. CACIAM 22H2]|nr:C4-dicarboxylate ABC transporter substrate-binding protein [Tagaea sp. CACIAM 22H2]